MKASFDKKGALIINKARLEHLGTLGLPLEGRSVLEVGAGVGLLTGFWEDRDCRVISTEGRFVNVAENLQRHPWREGRVFQRDLEQVGSHADLGQFEIVFAYGILYHVADPQQVIQDLAEICTDLFLIETRVYPVDDGQVHPWQDGGGLNQALNRQSCRPARDWIMDQLRERLGYAYTTITQPTHPQFRLSWPTKNSKMRAIFIGSRQAIDLPVLTETLPMHQKRLYD